METSKVVAKKSIAYFLTGFVMAIALFAFTDNVKAQTLTHTQFSGTLPEKETEGSAFIQWGGGTIYQLTARLAVNGCDLNLLWVWDSQQERYTAGYTFDGPSFLNNNFNNLYKDNIPPSVIWVKCIDMINHVYGYGLLSEEEKAWVDGREKGGEFDLSLFSLDSVSDCGNYWLYEIKNSIFTYLPLIPGTCVSYFVDSDVNAPSRALYPIYFDGNGARYHGIKTNILINNSDRDVYEYNLATELHELCHVNQYWHTVKHVFSYDFLDLNPRSNLFFDDFRNSDYVIEFINVLGFYEDDNGNWTLPKDSIYGGLYGNFHPVELSAELCSGYVMKKLGKTNEGDIHYYYERFLTDEVIAWLEKYVFVLPESRISE